MIEEKHSSNGPLNVSIKRDPLTVVGTFLLGTFAGINIGCATTDGKFHKEKRERHAEYRGSSKDSSSTRNSLLDLPRSLRDDRDLVMDVVSNSGYELIFASERLKNDREIVLTAVRDSGSAFSFASKKLKNDRDFIIRALRVNGDVFRSLDPKWQGDAELLLISLENNGQMLEFASDSLRDDPAIVIKAVGENGNALQYASPRLRGDPKIVLEAISSNSLALTHASPNLLRDKGFALEVLRKERWGLEHFHDSIRNDPDVIFEAIRISPYLIQFAGAEFLNDAKLMFQAAGIRGAILQHVSERFRQDEEFVFKAVCNEGYAVKFLAKSFIENPEFLERVVKENFYSYRFLEPLVGNQIDERVKNAAEAMQNALKCLGIDHPERFDHTHELLKNRYAVSSPKTQATLDNLLGANYFAESTVDNRPICVIIYPDHNDGRGFFELNASGDNIDRLTRAYRVVYYDVESDLEMARSLMESTVDRGEEASLLLIGGHGTQKSTYFGSALQESSLLDLNDLEKLKYLHVCLKKGAKIVLHSCSTGAGAIEEEGLQNIAELVHGIWLECYVFAPRNDTMLDVELDREGNFLGPGYFNSETLVISPQSP